MNRPYHHGDLKNTLLEIARRHLALRGADKLSLREVATEAGVSHSAAYRHFPDKRSLLAELATQGFLELVPPALAAQIEGGADEAPDLLQQYGLAYVEFGLGNPMLLQLMFGAQLSGADSWPALEAASQRAHRLLMQIVGRGVDSGRFAYAPADDLGLNCWAMVHGLALLLAAGRAPDAATGSGDARAAARRSISLFVQGIAAKA